jgi:hypothetical protein
MSSFPTEIDGLPLGFLQLGKIIGEFLPIFPVAQQVKRKQCLGVAIATMRSLAVAQGPTCKPKHSTTIACVISQTHKDGSYSVASRLRCMSSGSP